MVVTAVYRAYGGDGTKPRPDFYSKALAFESFLLALQRVPDHRLIVLLDEPKPGAEFLGLVDRHAHLVENLGGVGNARSYLRSLELACAETDSELVYLAEDDYLYCEDAFVELVAAAESLPVVDYFTLYDHPDRYRRSDDASVATTQPVLRAGSRHWRVTESTTMTFGARSAVLRADARRHRRFCGEEYPRDRDLWRSLQALGWRRFIGRGRNLYSALPGAATHLEVEQMSHGVDWEAVADRVATTAVDL